MKIEISELHYLNDPDHIIDLDEKLTKAVDVIMQPKEHGIGIVVYALYKENEIE